MARSHKSVEVAPSPRNAPGPSCACCGQPYSEDIGGERIEPIAFGGFLFIHACLSCHKCPLGGPCIFEEAK